MAENRPTPGGEAETETSEPIATPRGRTLRIERRRILGDAANRIYDFISHLFYPQSCPVCGRIGVAICDECFDACVAPTQRLSRCTACGGPLPCPRHGKRYELRVLDIYHRRRDIGRYWNGFDLVRLVKYEWRDMRIARLMGRRLATLVADLDGDWAVVTIPPHPRLTLVPHGDSHIEWMSRGLRDVTDWPERRCLRWREKRTPQKNQPDARARRALPADIFVCAGSVPRRVLLLDDVSTTGATLYRAAQCLYNAGAERVVSLCWSSPMIESANNGRELKKECFFPFFVE